MQDYVWALCREIEMLSASAAGQIAVSTVFFGGGTPSLLRIDMVQQIMRTLSQNFELEEDVEVTLEANPGTLSPEYLYQLRWTGINRLSLGMQSAKPEELRLLERQHDFFDIIQAVRWARDANFSNINLDLIFGLPEQTLDSWQNSLELACNFNPEHLSLYSLTLEHGTPMQHWSEKGLISQPDPDIAADMYEWASEFLLSNDYIQYEISNWASRGPDNDLLSCRHNLQYWRLGPYLGLGAGAHGYFDGMHTVNVLSPAIYIKRLRVHSAAPIAKFPRTAATYSSESIDAQREMGEVMMMGLRLTREGVSNSSFINRFGQSIIDIYGLQIDKLIKLGLLEWNGQDNNTLRLTKPGRLLGNQVFLEFV